VLSFFKYNIVALLATAVDFAIFVLLTKMVGIWYVLAAILSAVSGGMVAFWFNRSWVFHSHDSHIKKQALRYVSVWLGSILLNATGIYLMVDYIDLPEIQSKILVSITVGIFFNFLMNKYYVFKTGNI